jgi:hypothetical protein
MTALGEQKVLPRRNSGGKMNKKALMFSLIVLMIPVLYTISTVTATFNGIGKKISVKGGEFGIITQWAIFSPQAYDLKQRYIRSDLYRFDLRYITTINIFSTGFIR